MQGKASRGLLHVPGKTLCIAALLVCYGCQWDGTKTPQDTPPAPVKVVTARSGTVAPAIHSIGTVMPVDESLVAASLPGLVVAMPVRDGQYVEQGQLLVQLRKNSRFIRLQEARALLNQREQELEQLENGYREEEVLQAEARLRSAEALSKYAVRRADRAEQLRGQTAISPEQADEVAYEASRSQQAVAEAKADYQLKQKGYRHEQIEAARAARDAQQQMVLHGEDELARLSVVAPFAGFISQRHTEVGQWLGEGGPVVTLTRLDEVEVRVLVEEDAIGQIHVGQQVEVHVDSLAEEPIEGAIRAVVPSADWRQGSRSFPVIVRLPNTIKSKQPRLKEGMLARITFHGEPRAALLVDKDAIDRSSGQSLVYVVQSDRRVRAVAVQDGMSQGQFIEVRGDLRAGDLLVTEGVERLRPFQEVTVLATAADEDRSKRENGRSTAFATDSTDPAKPLQPAGG